VKPGFSTVTLYPPAGVRAGAEKRPATVVSRFRVMPFCGFETSTLASATPAPVESVTVPDNEPIPAVWAIAAAEKQEMQMLKTITRRKGHLSLICEDRWIMSIGDYGQITVVFLYGTAG
jgi:hypothetical protein